MIHFHVQEMNSQLSTSFLCVQCFLFLVLLNTWPSLAIIPMDTEAYTGCSIPFRCGNITGGYPFWGEDRPYSCGYSDLRLKCGYDNTTTITLRSIDYHVLKIDESAQTLKMVISHDICALPLRETPLDVDGGHTTITDSFVFDYSAEYEKLTIGSGCSFSTTRPVHLACLAYESATVNLSLQTGADVSGACNFSIDVLVSANLIGAAKGDPYSLKQAIYEGFELKWKLNGSKCAACKESGGSCGYLDYGQLICHCPDQPHKFSDSVCANLPFAPDSPPLSGSATGVPVWAVIIISILLISGVARMLIQDENYSKRKETIQNMETFVRNFGSLLPQKFEYSDVKKMTKSFSNKLGQGGYGDVYKGKLADGRLVAVKLLKESKGNGEEFINEVASICRTSHVNIVTLLGFCYTRNKRTLIYEFMSNGSLDNFIFDKESSSPNHNLEWKTRYQIAIGIARGLEYLHRGCNTRIVHFDIKPHNVLLDDDFCPKISDFGLAKLCKQKESVISMVGARGTVGYIAPEIFCRTIGGVSHKSDVYSYRMMVLEMVGGRENIDVIVSHTSEIYFPNWIYKRLEPGQDFEFHGVVTEEEKEIAKKMIIVSMWCIQTIPSDRPSMAKVLEMLEGRLERMQVPPKPSLSVPARSPKHSIPLRSFSTSTSSDKPASLEEEVCIDLSDK